MTGISTLGPLYIYLDNVSVMHNISRPKSILRNKRNLFCYHVVHEKGAMGESLVGHTATNENVANLMTKVIYRQKIRYLISNYSL